LQKLHIASEHMFERILVRDMREVCWHLSLKQCDDCYIKLRLRQVPYQIE
jgi:hypothetical protein